jgi:hypothetical protein
VRPNLAGLAGALAAGKSNLTSASDAPADRVRKSSVLGDLASFDKSKLKRAVKYKVTLVLPHYLLFDFAVKQVQATKLEEHVSD